MISGALKQALYQSGSLSAFHRSRNRRALTVLTLHRVLDVDDPRFAYCDPEYTLPAELFGACLDFLQRHYSIIAVDQLLADRPELPDCPLLITLDDGWADHEQVAMRVLAQRRMPALVFVAADAVDAVDAAPFWEMRLIHAFRRGTLRRETMEALWSSAASADGASGGGPDAPPPFLELADVRRLIARLDALAPERVVTLLAPLEDQLTTPHRHLLSQPELRSLLRNGIGVGGHGGHHLPLGRVMDPGADLERAAKALAQRVGGPVDTMSFPHGSYNSAAIDAARRVGFRLLFTTDPILNPVPRGAPIPTLLGRVGFDPFQVTDAQGRLRPERLALELWPCPHVLLTDESAARAA